MKVSRRASPRWLLSFRPGLALLRLGVLGLVLSVAGPASAQSDDERRNTARELAERAQDRLQAGDHEEALDLLRQADEAFHAPTISLLIARSLVKLERFAEGAEALDVLSDEALAEDAPAAWHTAQELARKERRALDDKVGTLNLEILPTDAEATVRIGERSKRPAEGAHLVDADAETNLRIEAKGHRVAKRTVSIAGGESASLTIELTPLAPDEPPPPPEEPPPEDPSFFATPWPTVIAASGAGLAFAIGSGLGAAAFSDASDLESRCKDAACSGATAAEREELRALQSSGGSLADGSTVAFVISGVAASAAGVFLVLWVTAEDGSTTAPSTSVRGGPGWVSVNGSF